MCKRTQDVQLRSDKRADISLRLIEDIEKEYEIFHVIKLPHESYIKELSNYGTTQTSTLDICDIITELIIHISKLKEF